jgi:hypothetical protein
VAATSWKNYALLTANCNKPPEVVERLREAKAAVSVCLCRIFVFGAKKRVQPTETIMQERATRDGYVGARVCSLVVVSTGVSDHQNQSYLGEYYYGQSIWRWRTICFGLDLVRFGLGPIAVACLQYALKLPCVSPLQPC